MDHSPSVFDGTSKYLYLLDSTVRRHQMGNLSLLLKQLTIERE